MSKTGKLLPEDAEGFYGDGWNHPDNPWPKVERMEKALRGLRYAAQVNQEQDGLAVSWAEVEELCKKGLGE
jgi:hypothetical protein